MRALGYGEVVGGRSRLPPDGGATAEGPVQRQHRLRGAFYVHAQVCSYYIKINYRN